MEVHVSGPIFDGRADLAVEDFIRDAVRTIGEDADTKVTANLDASIRVNHHNYTSHVHSTPQGDRAVVDDGGVVYGPWLEGVGSRNATTRFKGYASFRRALAAVRGSAKSTAETVLPRYLGRMQ